MHDKTPGFGIKFSYCSSSISVLSSIDLDDNKKGLLSFGKMSNYGSSKMLTFGGMVNELQKNNRVPAESAVKEADEADLLFPVAHRQARSLSEFSMSDDEEKIKLNN